MIYLVAACLMFLASLSILVFKKQWLLWLYDHIKWKNPSNLDLERFYHLTGWLYLFNGSVFFLMFLTSVLFETSDKAIVSIGDTIIVLVDLLLIFFMIKVSKRSQ